MDGRERQGWVQRCLGRMGRRLREGIKAREDEMGQEHP